MKFSVMYEVFASTFVDVDLPKGSTRAQIIAAADKEQPSASVCHQCSREVEIGDVGEVLEVLDDKGNEVKDKPPRARAKKK